MSFVRIPTNRLMKAINLEADPEDNCSTDKNDDNVISSARREISSPKNITNTICDVESCGDNVTTESDQLSDSGVSNGISISKQGDHIKCKIDKVDERRRTKVLSHGGTQTGKNRGWINIEEDGCEILIGII